MVSVKGQQMVSIEGGQWTCKNWNSSAAHGNTTTVTAIYFEDTSFSFIRNLKITACGMYSGGERDRSFSLRCVSHTWLLRRRKQRLDWQPAERLRQWQHPRRGGRLERCRERRELPL